MSDSENLKKKYEDFKQFHNDYKENSEKQMNELLNQLNEINEKLIEQKELNKKLEEENKNFLADGKSFKNDNKLVFKNLTVEKQNNLLIQNSSSKNICEKCSIFEKELKDKEKVLEEKEKEIKELNNKLNIKKNELNTNEIKINSMIKEINEQKEKIIKLEGEENNIIVNQKENIDNIIKESQTKSEFLVKSAEEYYDVVIDINSINSLKKEGWEIKYNKQRKEIYQKIIGEQTIKIGVIGLNNVGKSYLLSKIVRVEIPTGYSVETKGISIKYSQGDKGEEEGICILDSAGFETPLLKEKKISENNEIEKEEIEKEEENKDKLKNIIKLDEIEDLLSRDKAQTERFIEQLILSLSDMIILVVGKLTRTEQKLITRVKNLAKINEKNKIKSIIIVHNLAQYHKIIEVENHIRNYLCLSATFNLLNQKVFGVPEFKDRTFFVEKSNDQEDIEVFHYIMAKEGTEAGDYYNKLTIELIKQQFNRFNKRRKINIPNQITKLFSELSTEIIGEKMECKTLESDENRIVLKDKGNEGNKNTDKFIIQNAYIDQDGNYLQNKGKYEPKYSMYFYKEINDEEDQEDNYLLLRLEIPGNIIKLTARSTDPKKEKFKGIVIKGYKEKDKFDEQSKPGFKEIIDNRTYEEFSYFIELKRNLELNKKTAIGNTEIYKIKFDKKNKEKIVKDKDKKKDNQVSNDKNESKEVKGEMIASGVYIMKFSLTENSFT